MKKSSERRLKENEVIFRAANRSIKRYAKSSSAIGADGNLSLYCECSRLNCAERIEIGDKEFEKIHSNKNRFMVLAGHEIAEIEKVVKTENKYLVVEKYGEIPKLEEINLKLKPQEI